MDVRRVEEEPTLEAARSSVFKQSEDLDEARILKVSGFDFNRGLDLVELLKSFRSTGFQASNLGDAVDIVNQMLSSTPTHSRCKIFLGFTSNLVSSGIRETIRFLVEHKMVDVLVTTAGGIEEDLIKCLGPTYKGDFALSGAYLRSKGLNRIGNLLVPNNNYCKFEDWIMPIFDQMLLEQSTENVRWTPSKVISRLGKEINNTDSYLYWAFKNNIPVFCPALTDGSLGDMLGFHSIRSPGLIIDIVEDVIKISSEATSLNHRMTGMILLGGGLPKHHICQVNAICGGADYAVFINTGQEFDGSDSGAHPDEAISWGRIKTTAKYIKVGFL
ncbi:deoxyhypusine synthase-like [Wolffia australiana]